MLWHILANKHSLVYRMPANKLQAWCAEREKRKTRGREEGGRRWNEKTKRLRRMRKTDTFAGLKTVSQIICRTKIIWASSDSGGLPLCLSISCSWISLLTLDFWDAGMWMAFFLLRVVCSLVCVLQPTMLAASLSQERYDPGCSIYSPLSFFPYLLLT